MSRRKIFKICVAISLIISIIPIVVFKSSVKLSIYSIFTAAILICVSVHGVICYYCRNKGNYLRRSIGHLYFMNTKNEANFTEEYRKSFFREFLIYWIAVPFYIPCILLCHSPILLSLPTAIFLTVRLIYAVTDITRTVKNANEYRINSENERKELSEQQKREEMGKFR